MPTLSTMLKAGDGSMPHIGRFLSEKLDQSNLLQADLARKMNITSIGVSRYFKQPTIHVAILWNASTILKHNLFADLAALHPVGLTTKKEEKLQEKIDQDMAVKDQQIADLQKELAIYKEIVLGRKG